MALVQILAQQLLDFAKDNTKREFEPKEDNLDVEFRPASEYISMEKQELDNFCFDMYKEDCRTNNLTAAPHTDELLDIVRDKYSNAARKGHMYDFCSSNERRELLRAYAEKQVVFAKKIGKSQVASSLRFYLAASGEEMAPEIRASKARRLASAGVEAAVATGGTSFP